MTIHDCHDFHAFSALRRSDLRPATLRHHERRIDEAFRFIQGAFVAKLVGYIHQHSPQNFIAAPALKAPMNGFVVRIALRQHVPLRASVEYPQYSFEKHVASGSACVQDVHRGCALPENDSGCAPTARLSAESSDIYSRSIPPSNFEIGSRNISPRFTRSLPIRPTSLPGRTPPGSTPGGRQLSGRAHPLPPRSIAEGARGMTRHVIKIDASSFKDIRAGRQTCLIHRNDRLWNPGDEIWFAECDGDPLILNRDGRPYCYSAGGQFTGSVIRQLIIFTEFGGLGLEKGYVALYLQPLHRRLENLPVRSE